MAETAGPAGEPTAAPAAEPTAEPAGERTIAPDQHLAWILARIPRLAPAEVPLRDAHGLILAADVAAPHALPLWDNSAMDGYAVRAADLAAAAPGVLDPPVSLRVVGEVAAGSPDDPELPPGTAVRIMTGAPIPSAADTVVPVEHTRGEEPGDPWGRDTVEILRAPVRGANVRVRGEDVAANSILARAGDPLGARRLAALAAAGVSSARVRARPRVAVIATGSELRGPGEPLTRGQIPESNSLLLAALLAEHGIVAESVTVSADDAAAFRARLAALAPTVDVIITTGGVGPGRHDIARIALESEPDVRAVRVAVRPGQPQCAGALRGGAWIFALPGNPVSAAVSFELFVVPALRHVQGAHELERPRLAATAELGWRGVAGRLQVLPVRIATEAGQLRCRPAVDPRGVSHAVGGHGGADGYALVGAERGDVAPGERVDVILVGT
ncbi:gephyrin-like molybdotransferase Glp [Leucobacter chromiireducens]|uniref:Molybdopterin molybdenumtransferase n=1 Tax=Leucobacter chromiireducens subsp. solipictus TaxID=398235 RepID=A0ABS1SDW1_9MICO|nr:gephyrin-like molybdotransferase Glp [Leucobacter chromiireducens]MBL3678257.1 molybdopterin molybdenumtransferase MoeA [Leucobacter chromiireducens subsp. solipictus]